MSESILHLILTLTYLATMHLRNRTFCLETTYTAAADYKCYACAKLICTELLHSN